MKRLDLLSRVWHTLHEPRMITMVMIVTYMVTFIAGAMFVWNPADAMHEGVSTFAGLILVSSGAVGVPTAWQGVWWLERGAALGLSTGYLAGAFVILGTHNHYTIILPIITTCLIVLCALFGITRFLRVYQMPYEPGKGPANPFIALRAEEMLARTEAEAKRDRYDKE